jgi:hypothetical protein
MGDSKAAKQLFDLTVRAARGESLDLRVYRTLANLFGWSLVGRAAQVTGSFLKLRPGAHTLKQSWMK